MRHRTGGAAGSRIGRPAPASRHRAGPTDMTGRGWIPCGSSRHPDDTRPPRLPCRRGAPEVDRERRYGFVTFPVGTSCSGCAREGLVRGEPVRDPAPRPPSTGTTRPRVRDGRRPDRDPAARSDDGCRAPPMRPARALRLRLRPGPFRHAAGGAPPVPRGDVRGTRTHGVRRNAAARATNGENGAAVDGDTTGGVPARCLFCGVPCSSGRERAVARQSRSSRVSTPRCCDGRLAYSSRRRSRRGCGTTWMSSCSGRGLAPRVARIAFGCRCWPDDRAGRTPAALAFGHVVLPATSGPGSRR